jgi:hypothetical protein
MRRVLIGGAAVATALAAGAGAWTMRGPATPATAATAAEQVASAPVERRTLSEVADLDGTMAFADPQPLQPGSQGTVTWLPGEAATLRRGSVAARIDDKPVIALYGGLPVYRQLQSGDKGRDVRQLERNLHALGYDANNEITVDNTFTAATARAVKRLERVYGLEQDGVVGLDEVVYLPGARRVGTHEVDVGAHAGGKLYDTTARSRVVRIELDARKRSLVRRGKEVQIELPDGRLLKGVISKVGRVVRSEDNGAGGTKSVLDVEVAVTGNPGADGAPVVVHVVSTAVENALAVPVHALLALAGGGYGVELRSGGKIVPVELGASADGFVEVQGTGLAEGALVVVAQ